VSEEFHKPTRFSGDWFERIDSGNDPAVAMRAAHDSARTLLARGRETDDPEVLRRLVAYTDEHGIDALAELWARSSPRSLPGALWRIYLLRLLIRQDPTSTAYLYQRGSEVLDSIDSMVAGAQAPTGPEEITLLADQILRGVYTGDFAIALDRAAAFCRIMAAGATSLADDAEAASPDRASELTRRASRLALTAEELADCARLQRSESLD
jgi:hypothetical protein